MSKKEKFMNINLDFYSTKYKYLNDLDKYCIKPEDTSHYKDYQMRNIKNIKKVCKKKCDTLKENCNAFMIGNNRGGKLCRTFKTCKVEDLPSNHRFKHFAKKYKESFSIHTILFLIVMIEMLILMFLGLFAYSKYLRIKLNN